MLRSDPQSRPSVSKLLQDDFFSSGYLPPRLPTTCLTMAPRFAPELLSSVYRKPLHEINNSMQNSRRFLIAYFIWIIYKYPAVFTWTLLSRLAPRAGYTTDDWNKKCGKLRYIVDA